MAALFADFRSVLSWNYSNCAPWEGRDGEFHEEVEARVDADRFYHASGR